MTRNTFHNMLPSLEDAPSNVPITSPKDYICQSQGHPNLTFQKRAELTLLGHPLVEVFRASSGGISEDTLGTLRGRVDVPKFNLPSLSETLIELTHSFPMHTFSTT